MPIHPSGATLVLALGPKSQCDAHTSTPAFGGMGREVYLFPYKHVRYPRLWKPCPGTTMLWIKCDRTT